MDALSRFFFNKLSQMRNISRLKEASKKDADEILLLEELSYIL